MQIPVLAHPHIDTHFDVHLTWTQIERRYAQYCEQFTSIAMPPGFARLDLYVSRVDSDVFGYIMAAVRVAHWLDELSDWGVRWWADERADQAIRERIRLGRCAQVWG